MLEKHPCDAIQKRPPQAFPAPDDLYQLPIEKSPKNGTRAYPSDLLDFDPANRISIRDDGQGLERRRRQVRRPWHRVEPLEVGGVLRSRKDLIPVSQLIDLERSLGCLIHVAQDLDRFHDTLGDQVLVRSGDLVRRERRLAREERGFDDLFDLHSVPSAVSVVAAAGGA